MTTPQPGYYKCRLHPRGAWVPALLFRSPLVDPHYGHPMSRRTMVVHGKLGDIDLPYTLQPNVGETSVWGAMMEIGGPMEITVLELWGNPMFGLTKCGKAEYMVLLEAGRGAARGSAEAKPTRAAPRKRKEKPAPVAAVDMSKQPPVFG